MVNINWQFQASIQGGPSLAINQPQIQVAAYDVVQKALADGDTAVVVPIQPDSTPGDVVFVAISSDRYGAKLTYKVDKLKTTNVLDGPHLFIGVGAIAFLNSSQPASSLSFSNALGKPANIQVLVGRNVS